MNDITEGRCGKCAAAEQAVAAFVEACATARWWGETQSDPLHGLLGPCHRAEIEALRDAAIHQTAVDPCWAAVARTLMAACAVVVENGTEFREVAEWSESEDGGAVMCERIRQTRPNAEAVAADRARGALRRVAEAIEQVLDIEAALERYGWPRR